MKVSTMRLVFLAAVVAVTGACATMQPGGESLTGCLNTGNAEYYVLTEEKTKKTILVTGTPALASHASNHRVTVTGTMTREQDKEVLKATTVQHLAATCS